MIITTVVAAKTANTETVIQNDHHSNEDSGPNLSETGASKAMAAN